jgi:hypothetical protein
MFKTTASVTEPPVHDDVMAPAADPVPVSHLALDLPEPPVGGWVAYLAGRGLEVLTDDIGRPAVSRAIAGQLLTECREDEIRRREAAEAAERQALEADRVRRANMPTGIPAGLVPDGLRPAEAMMLAGESSAPRAMCVREQLLQRELAHRTEPELIYQPISPDEG